MQVSGEKIRCGWIRAACLLVDLIVVGFILYAWFIALISE